MKSTKKPSIKKSFRLFDFHVLDETIKEDIDGDIDEEPQNTNSQQFIIQMFGINEKGETCCLFIQDFQPFFYIKVGNNWDNYTMECLLSDMKKKINKFHHDSIVSYELVDHYKLYGFSGGKKQKFIKIVFKNTIVMNKIKNLWYSYSKNESNDEPTRSERRRIDYKFKGVSLELYEGNIPPLLRYFHIRNISPAGWVSFNTNRVIKIQNKSTTCDYECICPLKELIPDNEKETRVPYKICSFDIEASSSHGDFPVPVKTYKRLTTNIVDIFITKIVTTKDPKLLSKLLTKIILAAFGHTKYDDVDTVYPKKTQSKEKITKLIDILLNKSIDAAKKANVESDNSNILTIDSMFDKIKENHFQNTEDNDNENAETSDEPIKSFKQQSNTQSIQIDKNTKVIDVLTDPKLNRDEKIQIINDVMTLLFPQLEGDKVTFIGSTFLRYGETEPYLNHCLVLGSCDDVDGAVIETTKTEKELLLKWTDLIQKENPDIIIGYNIFGFDYEFMFRRSQENECEREFLLLSRKINELCAKSSYDDPTSISIENTKMAIASGEYDLRYFKMTGRLQIDMYAYFRRDFNLASYKLDDVSGEFISDNVKKIVCTNHPFYGDVTELYSQNLMGLHKDDYIHIGFVGFTSDYYKDGKKFRVLDIIRDYEDVETKNKFNVIIIGGHEQIDSSKPIKWTMAKDDVSPQDIFRLSNGSSNDRARVAKYCIQDCNLVHHLMNKIDVITGYVEMSSICSVPISFLIFRGQGIKLTSYVAKKCREKDTLMPDLDKTGDADGYEGAIVLPPKCAMYMDNPVACVDYASLYPSSMISQNYSHDSKVWSKEYNLKGDIIKVTGETDRSGNFIYDNIPGFHYIDMEFDTFKYIRKTPTSRAEKTKAGKIVCRWAQFPNNKKGIMPSILEELLKARADTRKMIKTIKDPFMQNILDKRQLGYKVTANSLYGQCGSRTSTFYEKDVAAATTATGRMMITYAKRMIEEVYGNLVYETACHGPVKCLAEYVYGDSVANYTPVYVRKNGIVDICCIDQLFEKYGNGVWSRCLEEGKQDKEVCELEGIETWSEHGWTKLYRVIRHLLAPHKKMIRILTHTGLVDVTDDHSLIKSDGIEISPKNVTIGTELLHHNLPTVDVDSNITKEQAEIMGLYDADGYFRIDQKNQISAAHACWLASSLGWKTSINTRKDKPDIYRVTMTKKSQRKNPIAIKKMHEIEYSGYVYDLTTENHHFAAGVGNIIVHNTDSVFFTFNLENPNTGEKIRGKPALEATIEIAQDVADLCTRYLKPPMELTYEKTLMPFILLSKKRYVGMLYETDPNKGKLKFMGLSLKRRDSCDYLKDVYGGILKILMDTKRTNSIDASIEYLNQCLNELVEGKVPMDKLMITKALRSDYKNPATIAHKVLADRIAKRDPGNKPKPGDRMKFVHFVCDETNGKKPLQGEKIETPEFIIQNKLQIDYNHYITNQLMKPLQQLFGLALVNIWEKQNNKREITTYNKDMQQLFDEFPDIEVFMKKKEKYCSAKIKTILFDGVLDKIYNKKHGIQTLNMFFRPK
jgi:DNA polymerase elongation subunit (family B)